MTKFVKKETKNKEVFRISINENLLNRLKHVKKLVKKDIDVNQTIENQLYKIVIDLEKTYKISSNDWQKADRCPVCRSLLHTVRGKNGNFLGCNAYPKCKYSKSIDD